jgi:DNA processing protein
MTDYNLLQQQIALTLLPNFGCRRVRTILSNLSSIEEFFKIKNQIFKKIPGIGETLIRQLNRDEALKNAENYVDYFIKNNHFNFHFYTDETFPKRLNECDDAPILLFSAGKMDLNPPKVVAIVGTRNATDYGKKLCEELILSLKGKNILITSGLAYGIDVYVHQLCVKHNIQTVGVLGHGLDKIYPSLHRKTAKEMLNLGGLLTEFLPGTNPDRENFPMRNRIVAGMSDATIVIESGAKGGSLITADLANDYNREVCAFPGDVFKEYSKGCNLLIKNNKANMITSSKDFLKVMNWEEKSKQKKELNLFSNLNEIEQHIMACFLNKKELSYDYIMQQTKLSFSDLSSNLLSLEFNGVLKAKPGKNYEVLT